MALEEISNAVLESVRHEVDLIIRSAQKEAEEKLRKVREEAEKECELWYQTATRNIDEEVSRKLVQVQGQINKEVLKEKNEIINKVFEKAKAQILSLPPTDYEKWMRGMLKKTITEGMVGKIRVHSEDVDLIRRLLSEIESIMKVSLTVDNEYLKERGGFLLIGKGYIIDYTLATILSDIQRDLVPEIAKKLFD